MISGNGLGTSNGDNVNLIYSTGSVVQSNIIGTDITGTVALSTTTYYGVVLQIGSYIVGGLTSTPGTGLGNVISGNGITAFSLTNDTAGSTTVIEGNIVGADPTGEHRGAEWQLRRRPRPDEPGHDRRHGGGRGEPDFGERREHLSESTPRRMNGRGQPHRHRHHRRDQPERLANIGTGVALADGSSDNTVGGTAARGSEHHFRKRGEWRLHRCPRFPGSTSSGNVVEGDYIGTDTTGTAAFGNIVGVGCSPARGNTIGGTAAGRAT